MYYKTIQGCAWVLLIALTLLILVVAIWGDWQAAAQLGLVGYFLLAILQSLITALQRRRDLARRTEAPAASLPSAPSPAPAVPPPAYCYTLTRGDGELRLDEQGALRFLACPKPSRLIRNVSRGLSQRSQAERSVTIPRDQLRVAVPFERLATGPSVVIGYEPPGNGLCWEEFILATLPTTLSVAQPTGDALTWAQALAPGPASPQLQQEASRYRQRIRRRSVRVQWTVCTLVYTTVSVVLFVVLVLAAPRHLLLAFSIAGGMWAVLMLLTSPLIIMWNR